MSEPARLRPGSETAVEKGRRLEAEARQIARGAVDALLLDLTLIAGRCSDVGSLTSLPPGLRDLIPRIGQQLAEVIEQARAVDARAS